MSSKLITEPLRSPAAGTPDRFRAARILARSFYNELRSSGYTADQVVALCAEVVGLIALDVQRDREAVKEAA